MKYQKIEITNPITNQITRHIIIERDDGSFVSFPCDPDNPHYQQFLKDLEVTP